MGNYIKYSKDTNDKTELCIDDVYVCTSDRGKGIGRKLVEQAIEYARANGYVTVGLYAEPQSDDGLDGDALIEFYRSCGFVSDGDCDALMTLRI